MLHVKTQCSHCSDSHKYFILKITVGNILQHYISGETGSAQQVFLLIGGMTGGACHSVQNEQGIIQSGYASKDNIVINILYIVFQVYEQYLISSLMSLLKRDIQAFYIDENTVYLLFSTYMILHTDDFKYTLLALLTEFSC